MYIHNQRILFIIFENMCIHIQTDVYIDVRVKNINNLYTNIIIILTTKTKNDNFYLVFRVTK